VDIVAVEKSGLYYPNKIGRIYLMAMEEVMGTNGIKAVLNLAKAPELIGNYPPNNLAREFDFADFGAIGAAIEEMYGPRGGRGLALRAGRASFAQGLSEFGSVIGASELAFKVIPLNTKVKVGLKAMAETFSKFSDQATEVEEADDHFVYTIKNCPVCWGRTSDRNICYGAVGILQEGLRWVSGGKDFRVEEIECYATGQPNCVFHIFKEPLN
jgi:predicted hydrocarbon binding protein